MNSPAVKDLLDKITERLATKALFNRSNLRKSPRAANFARGSSASRTNASGSALRDHDKTIDFLGFKTCRICSARSPQQLRPPRTRDLSPA